MQPLLNANDVAFGTKRSYCPLTARFRSTLRERTSRAPTGKVRNGRTADTSPGELGNVEHRPSVSSRREASSLYPAKIITPSTCRSLAIFTARRATQLRPPSKRPCLEPSRRLESTCAKQQISFGRSTRSPLSRCARKNIPVSFYQNLWLSMPVPPWTQGALRIVRSVEVGCGGRAGGN